MSVMSTRMLARRAADREAADEDELTDLVLTIIEEAFEELLIEALKDPDVRDAVIAAVRLTGSVPKSKKAQPPPRAAAIKASRRR